MVDTTKRSAHQRLKRGRTHILLDDGLIVNTIGFFDKSFDQLAPMSNVKHHVAEYSDGTLSPAHEFCDMLYVYRELQDKVIYQLFSAWWSTPSLLTLHGINAPVITVIVLHAKQSAWIERFTCFEISHPVVHLLDSLSCALECVHIRENAKKIGLQL